ncbi:class I SAM-dependent methyltransferase [Pseudovibrio sp. SPO723]|uniref:class I SAM-dependent methyltransferase n=1 Tax=Nesiotobacter zosterae TaxID=392721 RepID=UPI0029C3F02C|nr:class I SAM-dependent methyltransferase [Pseudovibrio sp. SPO723]MDX5593116.1 class I SAM-dependent methyltransferase [Pseudovibrio sp. SPO723]
MARPSPLVIARKSGYLMEQGARVAFYALYERAMGRIARKYPIAPEGKARPKGPFPDRQKMFADIMEVFDRDFRNMERGIYPMQRGPYKDIGELLSTGRRFLADVPKVASRRAEGRHQEVSGTSRQLPRYYRQNFHYQTDGWLSEDSARIYDFQVDVLFKGTTAVMRRLALAQMAQALLNKDRREVSYLDIACGTGGLLNPATRAFPGLRGTGIDLSEEYLRVARERSATTRSSYVCANAESLPFASNSLDLISCVYLFHELPPKTRRQVAAEIGRVLKSGGQFIFMDSLLIGDKPEYDGALEAFPVLFHEPYFSTYAREDIEGLFGTEGLTLAATDLAFVSRINRFTKT